MYWNHMPNTDNDHVTQYVDVTYDPATYQFDPDGSNTCQWVDFTDGCFADWRPDTVNLTFTLLKDTTGLEEGTSHPLVMIWTYD